MVRKTDVSVIVPVYNGEKTIKGCIQSLMGLRYPRENVEFIVVNNASNDRTAQILDSYKGGIRILYEQKRGAAAARNKGLLNARGRLIAFTDADCMADKEWLTNILLPLSDRSIGVVGGKILSRRPCNRIELFGERIHDHDRAINEFNPPYAITMNWASRLSVFEEVGLFDERFLRGQDDDLSHRIFLAGYKLIYQPEAIIYHKNERAFPGLFHEGYVHGYHDIKNGVIRKRDAGRIGRKRIPKVGIKQRLKYCFTQEDRFEVFCALVFELGRAIGKFLAFMRFVYLDTRRI